MCGRDAAERRSSWLLCRKVGCVGDGHRRGDRGRSAPDHPGTVRLSSMPPHLGTVEGPITTVRWRGRIGRTTSLPTPRPSFEAVIRR